MKGQWHIYNLKRRVAELPLLSWEVFEMQVQPTVAQDTTLLNNSDVAEDELMELPYEDVVEIDLNTCLFCDYTLAGDHAQDAMLEHLVEHMLRTHSLFIPDQDHLTHLASFLQYLKLIVEEYHECLYCGTSRQSRKAIQQHMSEKGHCLLNLEREPELLEFWEMSEDEKGMHGGEQTASLERQLSRVELRRLRSGRIATSKPAAVAEAKKQRAVRREAASKALTATRARPDSRQNFVDDAETTAVACTGSNERQLSRMTEQGMLGVTLQQRQALMTTEKKIQRSEQVHQKAEEWAKERFANKQKYYRAAGPMRPLG
jgi:pre-60S factor REI1